MHRDGQSHRTHILFSKMCARTIHFAMQRNAAAPHVLTSAGSAWGGRELMHQDAGGGGGGMSGGGGA